MHRRTLLHVSLLALLAALPAAGQTRPKGRAAARAAGQGESRSPRLLLTAADLLPAPVGLRLRPGLALPDPPPRLPPVDPADRSPEMAALARRVAQGTAAGLAGVVYDNRDRGHSALSGAMFPPMLRLDYAPDLVARGLDYGLALPILLPVLPPGVTAGEPPEAAASGTAAPATAAPAILAPVIGNSSTAITAGASARSLPRLAMTMPGGPERAFAGYAGNQTWVYPEHRDHDAADLFPANWPYMLVSQGSSRSDRPLLRAAALILGALPPAVRAAAEAQGLVGPVVQMLFRRGRVGGDAPGAAAAYLTGAAHPSVFDGASLNPAAMLALAGRLDPGDLPPLVRLAVVEEDFAPAAGLSGRSERLFDTPAAVARIWRGPAFSRAMVVSAALTEGRVARWHWVLLRGDPARVRIVAKGATARIGLDWPTTAAGVAPSLAAAPGVAGSRLDIGVFAETPGGQLSAPAFVSVSFPLHEIRDYAPGPQGMRLAAVDYDAAGRGAGFDPLLHWSAPWRDEMLWSADGAPAGWRRLATAPEGAAAAGVYDAAGRRDGRPVGYEQAGTPRRPVLRLRP